MDGVDRILARQFDAAWDMLEQAIEHLSGRDWKSGVTSQAIPARLAYHIVETADFYTHPDLDAFVWAGRFGVDWETEDPDQLPDAEAIQSYLTDVRAKVSSWITNLGEDALCAPDDVFFDEGMTHMDRALYVLRHTHQHLGELHALLHARGLPRPQWR